MPIQAPNTPSSTPAATVTVAPTPPEIVAVIAAAVSVVLDKPHRLISVEHAGMPPPTVNLWALAGRLEQFVSHKIR